MLCPIIFNSNTIELTVHNSCYFGLRLTLWDLWYYDTRPANLDLFTKSPTAQSNNNAIHLQEFYCFAHFKRSSNSKLKMSYSKSYPLASKASRDEANLNGRKHLHTPVYDV